MEGDRNPLVSSMAYSEGDLKVLIVVLKEEKNKQQKHRVRALAWRNMWVRLQR